MHMRIPVQMKLLGTPGAVPFALMAALNSSSLAVMSTVLALKALEQVGTSRNVSLLFMAVGAATLVTRFVIPELIRRYRRRWVYTGGVVMVGVAPLLVATDGEVHRSKEAREQLRRQLSAADGDITFLVPKRDMLGKPLQPSESLTFMARLFKEISDPQKLLLDLFDCH